MYSKMKTALTATLVFAAVMAAGPAAAADWTTVTAGIDFSGEITAVQAIIGIIATVIIVMTGGKFLLQALRKG